MKNVLMIIQNFHPTVGGAEKQALELSRALVKKGVVVTVLTPGVKGAPARESLDGVQVIRLSFGCGRAFRSFRFVLHSAFFLLNNLSKYDVFHIHLASSHSVFPSLLGRYSGKKVFVKLSGGKDIGELALSRRSFFGRIKILFLKMARVHLILVNRDQFEEVRLSGLDGLKTTLVPNGVNLEIFRPLGATERDHLRRQFGWTGRIFLFVGRFAKDKWRMDVFENVMKAWKRLFEGRKDVFFYLVGEGPLEAAYRDILRRENLENQIKFIGPRTDVAALYQAADFFVLPSLTEGLSNALLEAFACGRPVLASRVSGITDLVTEERQGYLFDPFDTEDVYKAFQKSDRSHKSDLLSQECQKVAEHYSLNRTVESFLALYDQ